ncbi:DUF2177 family protein [Octadecabacter sp. 1_MG-2023]|uniref:DUF2177 family protein n=1 Tax=unclassified Octadecabacter TaxID=196158 RepID=UPI001C097A53|nr:MULTISPECIES: DUF2177 family protein [unclassified Octadecabacter]MBU2994478.1 DUF2177 family protein [Octadecabacter sp. B2R22]MDO6734231.1 DUF2177 family protein [Octadecabacter sp. 1_MG-2023]
MNILILYLSTAVIFLAADVVGLRLLIKPVFERHVGHLFVDPFRVGPAAVFYLGYIAGVLWFVSASALRDNDPTAAFFGGIALGLLAYGTYEFTNYATLRDWSFQQVALDTIWGGILTGFAAWAGVMVTRSIG